MKQAILVVAFGTTIEEARINNIEPVFRRIAENFRDYDCYLAYSSRIIIKRLRERGVEVKTEEGLLEDLISQGYETVYVQPLHFTGGAEYEKLKNNIMRHEGEGQLKTLRVGRPLTFFLGQEGQPDDYQIFIDQFIKPLHIDKDQGLLMVGHGGLDSGNSAYGMLQYKLFRNGLSNVRICVLENEPYLESNAIEWDWYDGTKPSTVHIHPLLLVAGDHAKNDLFGDDEDSIKNQMKSAGFDVICHNQGLGAYESIQDLYVQHVKDLIADKYGKRPSRRPVIPNIK